MAKSSEHRMVFDLRGRRKRVVQVVYAILAVLMALSLLTVVGPFSIGDVFGTGGGGDTSEISLERAEEIERKLARDPENEELLLSLVKERIAAANNLVAFDETTGQAIPTNESSAQYDAAAEAWNRYLRVSSEQPSPAVATQMAAAFFSLAQTSTTTSEAQSNLEDAAEAQAIVAEARPSLGTLSTYAIYSYFALDFEQADKVAKRAVAAAPKAQRKLVEQELDSYRKQAKGFQKQVEAAAAQGGGKQAQEPLEDPLGGLFGEGGGVPLTP
jgi:hypothetical protein